MTPRLRALAASLAAAAALLSPDAAHAQEPSAEATSPPPPEAQGPTSPEPVAPCARIDGRGSRFATCFDPGNRLLLTGSNLGGGLEIDVRSVSQTTDPGITWRLEHRMLSGFAGPSRFGGFAYDGRFIRHARDGHLIFPTSPPTQLSVPFDIGAEAQAGRLEGVFGEPKARVGAVRASLLADFARASTFRYRAAIGPVVRWDMIIDRDSRKIDEHLVAPFTVGQLSLYAESENGLTLGRLVAEAGSISSTQGGFRRHLGGELSIERVLVSLNDRPVSLYLAGRYADPGPGLQAEVGLRFAVLTASRTDERP